MTCSERDWLMLTDWRLGDPLADIHDWMLRPYTPGDLRKHEEHKEDKCQPSITK